MFVCVSVVANLLRSRVRAVPKGSVSTHPFRLYPGDGEPEETAQPSRLLTGRLKASTLIWPGGLAAAVAGDPGAWLAARLIHTRIRFGTKSRRPRISAYFITWPASRAL